MWHGRQLYDVWGCRGVGIKATGHVPSLSAGRHTLTRFCPLPTFAGTIDFEEFVEMMTGKMGDRDSPEEIRRVFKLFDDDETGKISFRNLKRVARELGENMTDEELQEMINKADLDGDGEVNEDEFMRIMTYKHSFKAGP